MDANSERINSALSEHSKTITHSDSRSKRPSSVIVQGTVQSEFTDALFTESDSIIFTPSSRKEFKYPCFSTLVTLASIIAAVPVFTVIGGAVFLHLEKGSTVVVEDHSDCFNRGRRVMAESLQQLNASSSRLLLSSSSSHELASHLLLHAHSLSTRALDTTHLCLSDSKKITNLTGASIYSWSLYTTIGYGDVHTTTAGGRWASIVFNFFAAALYLAVKAEFGVIFSRQLSAIILLIRYGIRRMRGRRLPYHLAELRPIFRFTIVLFLLVLVICGMAVYLKSLEKDWNWETSFYFSYITTALIGLGDVMPEKKIPFVIYALPFLLVGDTLFAQVNWYMQDRIRFALHWALRRCLPMKEVAGRGGGSQGGATPVRNDYPPITRQMMPMDPDHPHANHDEEGIREKKKKKKILRVLRKLKKKKEEEEEEVPS